MGLILMKEGDLLEFGLENIQTYLMILTKLDY